MKKPRHIETLEYGPGKALKTTDPALTRIFQEVRTIYALADFPVVVQGETGTGKEGVARAVHWHSPRRNKPFVAVNCGAIPEGLIDSEFFGHERGAFSGAAYQRKGHFEAANGGTLFLDEIGEMPLGLQARLLRVLQEREVVRVGSSKAIPVDVRVVAATNRDLMELVEQKKFGADLFYRIATVVVHIPPLRERKNDILMLSKAFINQSQHENVGPIKVQPLAAHVLRSFPWPGNVRELRNAILVACSRCIADGRSSIAVNDFQSIISYHNSVEAGRPTPTELQLKKYLADHPRASIMETAAFFGVEYHAMRRIIRKLSSGE